MINKPRFNSGSGFPNQFVPDIEKDTYEYGLRVGHAIESEWFSRDYGSSMYGEIRSEFLTRRLYARGEQPVDKYKNELAVNGDLSYMKRENFKQEVAADMIARPILSEIKNTTGVDV